MEITHTYFKKGSNEFKRTSHDSVENLLDEVLEDILYREESVVYLFGVVDIHSEGYQDVYVTDNGLLMEMFIGSNFMLNSENNVIQCYLQEYESYQDAYDAALDLKESNPLCYNADHFKN